MKSIVIFSNRTYNYLQLTQHPLVFFPDSIDGEVVASFFPSEEMGWDGYTAGAEQRGMGWDGMGMMDGVGR